MVEPGGCCFNLAKLRLGNIDIKDAYMNRGNAKSYAEAKENLKELKKL